MPPSKYHVVCANGIVHRDARNRFEAWLHVLTLYLHTDWPCGPHKVRSGLDP